MQADSKQSRLNGLVRRFCCKIKSLNFIRGSKSAFTGVVAYASIIILTTECNIHRSTVHYALNFLWLLFEDMRSALESFGQALDHLTWDSNLGPSAVGRRNQVLVMLTYPNIPSIL